MCIVLRLREGFASLKAPVISNGGGGDGVLSLYLCARVKLEAGKLTREYKLRVWNETE